jgi:hypothetical protein
VAHDAGAMRFAERILRGLGEDGTRDEIVVWIERRPGAVWAVGRATNPSHRNTKRPRPDDYVFEGYELGDALEAANNALGDDREISRRDGVDEDVAPFTEDELLRPLERWFFGHNPTPPGARAS